MTKPGLVEEIFYFPQGSRVPNLRDHEPNKFRRVPMVKYEETDAYWPGFTQLDNYAVRWSGFLIIKQKGKYKFKIKSNDGSKLFIDKRYVINDDGIHGMRSREASVELTAGQHYLRLEMFQKDGKAGMVFMYQGKDTRNEMRVVGQEVLRYFTARGFREEVFYIADLTRMPSFDKKAAMERVIPHVVYANTKSNWPGFAQSQNFACRWTGNLEIKRGGRYRFSLISDDGSRLFLNNKMIVDNDGQHSLKNQEGIVALKRGRWPIKLLYFQHTGNAGMVFRYMGFDTGNKMTFVPRTAMFVAY